MPWGFPTPPPLRMFRFRPSPRLRRHQGVGNQLNAINRLIVHNFGRSQLRRGVGNHRRHHLSSSMTSGSLPPLGLETLLQTSAERWQSRRTCNASGQSFLALLSAVIIAGPIWRRTNQRIRSGSTSHISNGATEQRSNRRGRGVAPTQHAIGAGRDAFDHYCHCQTTQNEARRLRRRRA